MAFLSVPLPPKCRRVSTVLSGCRRCPGLLLILPPSVALPFPALPCPSLPCPARWLCGECWDWAHHPWPGHLLADHTLTHWPPHIAAFGVPITMLQIRSLLPLVVDVWEFDFHWRRFNPVCADSDWFLFFILLITFWVVLIWHSRLTGRYKPIIYIFLTREFIAIHLSSTHACQLCWRLDRPVEPMP